jgi:XamI restriction endonuclease
MKVWPVRWTREQLAADADRSAVLFRQRRLAVTTTWTTHYQQASEKFERLLTQLRPATPALLSEQAVGDAFNDGLGEALRYLAGPPISDDDLQIIAQVDSLSPGKVSNDSDALARIRDVIVQVLDPHRFPWVAQGREPTSEERHAAVLASSVLLAAQRVQTERRMQGKDSQESDLKACLRGLSMTEVPASAIHTIVKGPASGQFCGECALGERKADVVVRLHDTRLLAIECKVSNSATNSIKRLNNDAAVKAEYWLKQFGQVQVVPAALLSGVFNVLNLEQSQQRGLALFWAHDLSRLGAFIDSTR